MTTRRLILTLGVVLIPTLAFTLHDLVFQLPDNQHEVSLGFFLTAFGLLFVWALGGYLAAGSTCTALAAIRSGIITAVLSVGILWLTFFALNRLFTDRMSYEPDRIRAFRASGYPTMRDYVSHGMGLGPFPLLMGVAIVAGMTGSVLGNKRQNRVAQIA